MIKQHITPRVFARGQIPTGRPNSGQSARVARAVELYLDTDGLYRWYESGRPTRACCSDLRTAVTCAHLEWPEFRLSEGAGETDLGELRQAS